MRPADLRARDTEARVNVGSVWTVTANIDGLNERKEADELSPAQSQQRLLNRSETGVLFLAESNVSFVAAF